ncbi:hypothetical protein QCA50_018014 [Cerrena zonata]|uniref:Chromatin elongation factor spt5 n=1 Tax=Cerrena zonata TaxID=2478898 RepID=A0AAW0FJD6_9APHY
MPSTKNDNGKRVVPSDSDIQELDNALGLAASPPRKRSRCSNPYLDLEAVVDNEGEDDDEPDHEENDFIDYEYDDTMSLPDPLGMFEHKDSDFDKQAEEMALCLSLESQKYDYDEEYDAPTISRRPGGPTLLRSLAAPNVEDKGLWKIKLRSEHRGKQRAIELMFDILCISPGTSTFDGCEFGSEVPSAFTTPVDSYSCLYLEGISPSFVLSFISRFHYPESSVSLVPTEHREVLLTFDIEDKCWTWTRLPDGSLGFILDHEDHEGREPLSIVAAPPLLCPLNLPKGPKQRRLYTYADILPLLSKLRVPSLSSSDYGTHTFVLKGFECIDFMGPLLITQIPTSKLKPISHPDPFELSIFFDAKDAWSSLLDAFRCHPNLNIDAVDEAIFCSFLTPEEMVRLGRRFAALRLTTGDHVTVVGKDSEVKGSGGVICNVAGDNMHVRLFHDQQTVTIHRNDLCQVFLPLSLVEVVSGYRRGARGMVLYNDADTISILDDSDSTNIFTTSSFCLKSRLDNHHQTRPLDKLVPLHDISRRLHSFTKGDHVIVQMGLHKGSRGTIISANWDTSYQVCKAIVPENCVDQWLVSNGHWVPTFPYDRRDPTVWRANDPTLTITVFPEEISFLDPAKTLDEKVGRDFLVGKRIVVQGAHEHKGMCGFVSSVDIGRGLAQVSLDAKTVSFNKLYPIELEHLVLDVSNSRNDIYLQLGINSSATYVYPAQLPVVIPRVQSFRPPTPPHASTSTDPTWAPDALDNTAAEWSLPSPTVQDASWLLEPEAFNQLNAKVSFRVGVRKGKGGRTIGWTMPAAQRPPTIAELAPGEILVDVMAKSKAKAFKGVFKPDQLLTIHLTKTDVFNTVWLLVAQGGQKWGVLEAFDTEKILTENDYEQYQRGSHVAVNKFKLAMCTVVAADGNTLVMRNENLVRFSLDRKI